MCIYDLNVNVEYLCAQRNPAAAVLRLIIIDIILYSARTSRNAFVPYIRLKPMEGIRLSIRLGKKQTARRLFCFPDDSVFIKYTMAYVLYEKGPGRKFVSMRRRNTGGFFPPTRLLRFAVYFLRTLIKYAKERKTLSKYIK